MWYTQCTTAKEINPQEKRRWCAVDRGSPPICLSDRAEGHSMAAQAHHTHSSVQPRLFKCTMCHSPQESVTQQQQSNASTACACSISAAWLLQGIELRSWSAHLHTHGLLTHEEGGLQCGQTRAPGNPVAAAIMQHHQLKPAHKTQTRQQKRRIVHTTQHASVVVVQAAYRILSAPGMALSRHATIQDVITVGGEIATAFTTALGKKKGIRARA